MRRKYKFQVKRLIKLTGEQGSIVSKSNVYWCLEIRMQCLVRRSV